MQSVLRYPGLQNQPDRDESQGRVRLALKRFLRAQFGQPTGALGHVVGRLMARDPSNLKRIDWTISLLDIAPTDRVLEIGMGPGVAIQRASAVASEGYVVGVDHSDVMVRQASRRNARAVRDGKVELRLGSASQLPAFSEPFDKIFSINSIHFWTEPVECLKALRKMLKPGGVIAVTLQPRSRSATDATAEECGRDVVMHLEKAGFSRVSLEMRSMKPVAVACARGVR
jgi:SAM-dependent methyltransferase